MEKPYLFIVNPKAGVYAGRSLTSISEYIEERMRYSGKVCQIIVSEEAGHAGQITTAALQSDQWAAIVAVGGDGTVNEIATRLRFQSTPLGIIPMGSGNGLARHLHIPMSLGAALTRLVEGTEVMMDSALLDDRPYFCVAGMGFDAEVGHLFSSSTERGLKTYIKISLEAYKNYKPQPYKVNGMYMDAFLLSFANAGQFGNNAWIAPKASVTDGLLDLCHVKPFPEWYSMVLGARLFAKTLDDSDYTSYSTFSHITVEAEQPPLMHYDGEPYIPESNSVTIQVVPQSLKVVC